MVHNEDMEGFSSADKEIPVTHQHHRYAETAPDGAPNVPAA